MRFPLAGLLALSLAGLACSKFPSQNAPDPAKESIPASGVRLKMPPQTGKAGGRPEPGTCVVDGDCAAGFRCVAGRCSTGTALAPRQPPRSR